MLVCLSFTSRVARWVHEKGPGLSETPDGGCPIDGEGGRWSTENEEGREGARDDLDDDLAKAEAGSCTTGPPKLRLASR